jgi:hypothetical protein
VRSGPGEARTILLLYIIRTRPSKQSLVARPSKQSLLYVPSSRYIWNLAPILFLQEQLKDIIISCPRLFVPARRPGASARRFIPEICPGVSSRRFVPVTRPTSLSLHIVPDCVLACRPGDSSGDSSRRTLYRSYHRHQGTTHGKKEGSGLATFLSLLTFVHLYQLLPCLDHETNFLHPSRAHARSPGQMAANTDARPLTCRTPPPAAVPPLSVVHNA